LSRRIALLRQRESCRILHLFERRIIRGIAHPEAGYIGLKWIKRSLLALARQERKVRTPQDRVAVNDGPGRPGESTTENIPPAASAAGKVEMAR